MADNPKSPKPGDVSKTAHTSNIAGNDQARLGEVERVSNQLTCLNPNTPPSQRKKAPPFQITSVSVGTSNSRASNDGGDDSADDLDESHTDDFSVDNSRVTDIENETPSFSEDTFSKDEVYFNPPITSVPVIPTSAQYGLAIVGADVETCLMNKTNHTNTTTVSRPTNTPTNNPTVAVIEPGSTKVTANTKNEPEVRELPPHHVNRNERFKVVKIESTEPFKRGRWTCMDYLDHSILPQQHMHHAGIIVKKLDSDPHKGTHKFTGSDPVSGPPVVVDNLAMRSLDEQMDSTVLKSGAQDNQLCNQLNSGSLTTRPNFAQFPMISPGQSLCHAQDIQMNSVSNQPQQMSVQSQQHSTPSHQVPIQTQHLNPQQMGFQPQQLSALTQQLNPLVQHQFTPQQRNSQSPQFNTTQQVSQSQHMNQQTQLFNTQNVQLNAQPQQFTSQGQHFNCQTQQIPSQLQQTMQGTNFQTGTTQISQGQSMTMQCAPTVTSAQVLQHQSLPPQQLQQLLNAVTIQQMGVQQGLAQQQLMQQATLQGLNQYQQQSQYFGQGGIQMLPPQGGMAPVGMSTPASSIASSVPLPLQGSGAIATQNLVQIAQRQQITAQAQQQQQMVNQQAMHQLTSRLPHNVQQIPLQLPIQTQYSLNQQYPIQHQQPFSIQQYATQQQPNVSIFPVQQQQMIQQNYQPLPNIQQPGQQALTRNVSLGESQNSANVQSVAPGSMIQVSHLPGHVPQNYHHRAPSSNQNELVNTKSVQTDKHVSARSVITAPLAATDTYQSPPILPAGILGQSLASSGPSKTTRSDADHLPLNLTTQGLSERHVDLPTIGEEQLLGEEADSLSDLAFALVSSGRHICRKRGGCPSFPYYPSYAKPSRSFPLSHKQGFTQLVNPTSRKPSPVSMPPSRDEPSVSGTSAVAIDNKIEQAMDLVKSHLMFAVREEVEVLKEKIAELMERISQLEVENNLLRPHAPPELVAQLSQPPGSAPAQQPPFPPNS